MSKVLIPKDSDVRRIPVDVERQTVLFLDGVRYSIQIFELASHRLAQALHHLGNHKKSEDDLSVIIAGAVADAWTMIDSVHRLRELLEQMPRMKKNTPELQLFLRRTSAVEDLRHFFQHFRSEIHSFADKAMPLWGTIAWSQLNRDTGLPETHTIVPGTFFAGVWAGSCTFDSQQGRFVERVLLHAGPKKVDLADLDDYVKEVTDWYIGWFGSAFTGEEREGADSHIKYSLKPVTDATTGAGEADAT